MGKEANEFACWGWPTQEDYEKSWRSNRMCRQEQVVSVPLDPEGYYNSGIYCSECKKNRQEFYEKNSLSPKNKEPVVSVRAKTGGREYEELERIDNRIYLYDSPQFDVIVTRAQNDTLKYENLRMMSRKLRSPERPGGSIPIRYKLEQLRLEVDVKAAQKNCDIIAVIFRDSLGVYSYCSLGHVGGCPQIRYCLIPLSR